MATPVNTTKINLSLPKGLWRHVDGKVASGTYGSADEFVREAIREKLERDEELKHADTILVAQLIQGLDSGKPIPVTPGHFKAKKQALLARAAKKKRP